MNRNRIFLISATVIGCLGFLPALSLIAQNSADAAAQTSQAPSFDVASIRQHISSTGDHNSIYNDPRESHLRIVNLSLKDVLQYAYGMPKSQIIGGPSWLDNTMFDIDAKSDASVDAELHALPSQEARLRKQLMVQTLLRDRFQLIAHTETRQLPLFALVVAKNGPIFKPSTANGTTINTGTATGASYIHEQGSDHTLDLLARALAEQLGRVVLNRTGIDGRFDLVLRWTPDDRPPPMLNGQPDPNAPPDIFTAIKEQLGLKLEPGKGPVPVLVIDHIAMPSEN
jgi:uncharacterized protein (TIGR03435 family)